MQDEAVKRVEQKLFDNIKLDSNGKELAKIEKEIKKIEKHIEKLSTILLDDEILENAELKNIYISKTKEATEDKNKLIARQDEIFCESDA